MSQGSSEGPPQQPWCSPWPPRRVPPDKPADTGDPPETVLLPGGVGRGRTIAISVGAWGSWGSPPRPGQPGRVPWNLHSFVPMTKGMFSKSLLSEF